MVVDGVLDKHVVGDLDKEEDLVRVGDKDWVTLREKVGDTLVH